MLKYNLYFNHGNEALQTSETITANEAPEEMTQAQLAREIHHRNSLIPLDVAETVLSYFCDTVAQAMGEGKCVNLCKDGEVFLHLYADLHLSKTFNLEEARRRGFQGNVLTEDAAALITPSDIVIKAKAETEQKFTDLVRRYNDGIKRLDLITVDKIMKKTSTTTPTTPTTPEDEDERGV